VDYHVDILMKSLLFGIGLLILLPGILVKVFAQASLPASSQPNIILIVADDLGYGELGCYGQQKIETPNIDRLADEGIRFTQFYAGSPVCAPSRCVLLTGLHTGHAQIRGNDEWKERGNVWDYRAMLADSTLEGQKPMKAGTVTIGSLLQRAGYTTGLVGKWGLGAPHSVSAPNKSGFDFFFGYNCQRQAHTYYPVHLYRNEKRIYLANDTLAPHTKLAEGADPYDPENYASFLLNEYAPDLMFHEITDFVDRNHKHPFFLLWATPIPHAALQAPEEWVDHYVRKFGDEEPYTGDQGYFPVRYPHATYAAMISYLDEQVGMLVEQLKVLGIHENTLILFTSDNGPTYNGGTDSPWFDSGGPFQSEYGYGKGFLHEGGIRVPLIVNWPGKIEAGRVSDLRAAFWDVLPTCCDMSGTTAPEDSEGISFLPELLGKYQEEHNFLYWEFPEYGGQQAIIYGHFKAIRKDLHKGNARWEVFDLAADPEESTNIAELHPDIIRRIDSIATSAHKRSDNPSWQFELLGDRQE
jgi:arylsulfatase A-like enzyme